MSETPGVPLEASQQPNEHDPQAEIARLQHELKEKDALISKLRDTLNETGKAYMVEKIIVEEAELDPVTELLTRDTFESKVIQTLTTEPPSDSQNRHYNPGKFSIIFIDLDHFKKVNDTFGHEQGDRTLREAANCLTLRTEDMSALTGRWGGEELVIALPWTARQDAIGVAERCRLEISGSVNLPDGSSQTASFGVAEGDTSTLLGESGKQSLDSVMRSADMAMYAAKFNGRDKTAYYDPTMESPVLLP